MMDLVDPTISTTTRKHIDYVPRPQTLKGLRIGLVENTKNNSEAVLRIVAEKLAAAHGMKMEALVHKPQRGPLKDDQIAELKGRADFAIIGVGA